MIASVMCHMCGGVGCPRCGGRGFVVLDIVVGHVHPLDAEPVPRWAAALSLLQQQTLRGLYYLHERNPHEVGFTGATMGGQRYSACARTLERLGWTEVFTSATGERRYRLSERGMKFCAQLGEAEPSKALGVAMNCRPQGAVALETRAAINPSPPPPNETQIQKEDGQ